MRIDCDLQRRNLVQAGRAGYLLVHKQLDEISKAISTRGVRFEDVFHMEHPEEKVCGDRISKFVTFMFHVERSDRFELSKVRSWPMDGNARRSFRAGGAIGPVAQASCDNLLCKLGGLRWETDLDILKCFSFGDERRFDALPILGLE